MTNKILRIVLAAACMATMPVNVTGQQTDGERRERPDGERRQRPDGERRQRPDGERRQRPDGERRERPDGERRQRPDGGFAGRPGGGPPQGGGFMRMLPIMAALDADGNGEISADEIKGATAALKTLDKNKDGKLTADELRPNFGGNRGGFGGRGGIGPRGERSGRPSFDGDTEPQRRGPERGQRRRERTR